MPPAPELTGLSGWVADVMDALGEVGVALLVLLENLFPPIPSEVVLPLAGYLASQDRLDLVTVLVAATAGSVVGAQLLYEAGARLGTERLRRVFDRMWLVDTTDLDRAQDWFARHGQSAVLLGRCAPVVRSLVSVPAGVARMPRGRFLLLTALGSGVWNTAFVLAGYLLGARFAEVERFSTVLDVVFVGLLVVGLALLARRVVRRARGRGPAPSAASERPGSPP